MGGKEAARLRIPPEVIVGDVWVETRPARYTAQGFLGLGIGLFEVVMFAPLAARWALPVGAAAGLAAGGFRRSGAEVEIAWRARGRDVTRVAPDEPFHCRDRPAAAGDRHKPAASALSALMRVVPEDADDGMDEAELLITLKAAGHAENPVRQALRGAPAWDSWRRPRFRSRARHTRP